MYAEHFHPETILAAGPSAKVYRGVEVMTGRKVMIKTLLHEQETAQPLDRQRLQLLAPSLMQMRHPQIAGLISLLPGEDQFALVAEYMPGMNARTFAGERKPSPADLRALAVQLMHALLVGEHLRQPHGDPKPSNLIIADHPGGGLFLQVQDWGLSLARQAQPPETLWFRAPELHAGGHPTTQSDLFTAAGSLFCIATNTAPAQGATVAEIMAGWYAFNAGHVLSHLRPDLDPPLRDWLAWLLNLAPQQRPHSVAQALDVLMLSMHTGFTYLPQQAPALPPGAQTTPLMPAPPPNAQPTPVQPTPVQPASAQPPSAQTKPAQPTHAQPKPVQPKRTQAKPGQSKSVPAATPVVAPTAAHAVASVSAAPAPAAAKKKLQLSRRALTAVVLNLAALTFIGFCLWPSGPATTPSGEMSDVVSATTREPVTAPATPKKKAGSKKPTATTAKKKAAAKPAAAAAVTAAEKKSR